MITIGRIMIGSSTLARMFARVFLASLMVQSVCLAQGHCGARLSPFVDGPAVQRLQRITESHAMGKQAIPMLLGEIGDTELAPVSLANPILSYRPFTSPTYCGVVAAYLIDLILGQGSLSLQAFPEGGNFMIEGAPENYVFSLGYITHASSGKPIQRRTLSKIEKLYADWWKVNAGRNLEAMRDDWRKGKGPLTGSAYKWE